MVGDMRGRGHAWWGACVADMGCAWHVGGMHGRGHAWQGVRMAGGRAWHTANERAERILLECILVKFCTNPSAG